MFKQACGKQEREMVLGHTSIQMGTFIKVIGPKINKMGMEHIISMLV